MTSSLSIYPEAVRTLKTPGDEIAETWAECGTRIRPLRDNIFVRTRTLPEMIGKIYIPPAQRTNYAGLPHQVMVEALVLEVGPDCRVIRRGQQIAFSRLFFARYQEMSDKTLVGWIREDQIACEEDVDR